MSDMGLLYHGRAPQTQGKPCAAFEKHQAMSRAMSGLNEQERARILAKSALFAPPPAVLPDGRRDLVGLSREELIAEMAAFGEKPFRAKQLWHWIYP